MDYVQKVTKIIRIDDSFNIHIYRHENFTPQQLIKIISTNQEGNIENFVASETYKKLQEISGRCDNGEIIEYLKYDCKADDAEKNGSHDL